MHTYLCILFVSLMAIAPGVQLDSPKAMSDSQAIATEKPTCQTSCSDRGSGRRDKDQHNALEKERGSGRREADTPAGKKLFLG